MGILKQNFTGLIINGSNLLPKLLFENTRPQNLASLLKTSNLRSSDSNLVLSYLINFEIFFGLLSYLNIKHKRFARI